MTSERLYTLERKADSNDVGHSFEDTCFLYDYFGEHIMLKVKFKRWSNEEEYEATILEPFDDNRFDNAKEDLRRLFDLITIKTVYNYNSEKL